MLEVPVENRDGREQARASGTSNTGKAGRRASRLNNGHEPSETVASRYALS